MYVCIIYLRAWIKIKSWSFYTLPGTYLSLSLTIFIAYRYVLAKLISPLPYAFVQDISPRGLVEEQTFFLHGTGRNRWFDKVRDGRTGGSGEGGRTGGSGEGGRTGGSGEGERTGDSREGERRGDSREGERRGDSREGERRGDSREGERTGGSGEAERTGGSGEGERTGGSGEGGRTGGSGEGERRGDSREGERTVGSGEGERTGGSGEGERVIKNGKKGRDLCLCVSVKEDWSCSCFFLSFSQSHSLSSSLSSSFSLFHSFFRALSLSFSPSLPSHPHTYTFAYRVFSSLLLPMGGPQSISSTPGEMALPFFASLMKALEMLRLSPCRLPLRPRSLRR